MIARVAARTLLALCAWVTIGAVVGVISGWTVATSALSGALITGLLAVAAFDPAAGVNPARGEA